MVSTRKFSQFVAGGVITTGDEPVGLNAGVNTIWDYIAQSSDQIIEVITQDTSGLEAGKWVRINSSGLYVHGIATSAEEAEIAGLVKEILSPTQFILMQSGYITAGTAGFSALTPGTVYFLSDTSLGSMTDTPPTDNGRVYLPLFYTDTENTGWVIQLKLGTIIGTPAPIPATSSADSGFIPASESGNTLMIGNWVYVTGDNTFGLADATNFASSQSIGVVTTAGDPSFTIQFSGFNTNTITSAVDSTGAPIAMASATVYYLSEVVPGAICPTQPLLGTSYSKPLFISISASDGTGVILPQRPLLGNGSSTNIIGVNQVGHGFTRGQAVRVSGAGTYTAAQANNFTNTKAVGIVIRVIDANNFVLQTEGYSEAFGTPYVNNPLTPNAQYYLSDVTPGLLTLTEPTTPGSYSKPMLIGLNNDIGFILEQKPTLITGGGGIIQVESITYRSPFLIAGSTNTWNAIAGFTHSITPSSSSSQVKVTFCFGLGMAAASSITQVGARLLRNGSVITNATSTNATTMAATFGGYPGVSSSHTSSMTFTYVDSPATTSPVTYSIELFGLSGSTVATTYRVGQPSSSAIAGLATVSTIILEEIG